MKIIFLDIDGVLNSEETYQRRSEEMRRQRREGLPLTDIPDVDEEKIQILVQIIKETGAKVVLDASSRFDWKFGVDHLQYHSEKAIQRLFDKYGIEVIGITPLVLGTEKGYPFSHWKESEIMAYLKEHKVECFCIIDDESKDLQSLTPYLVKTSFRKNELDGGGLQPHHIEEAVKILNFHK